MVFGSSESAYPSGCKGEAMSHHIRQANPALGQDSLCELREFHHLPEDARSRRVGQRRPLVDYNRRSARTDDEWHPDIGDRVLQNQHNYEGRVQRTASVERGGGIVERAATVVEKFRLND